MGTVTEMLADIRREILQRTGEAPDKVVIGDTLAGKLADELSTLRELTGKGPSDRGLYDEMRRGGFTFMGMEIEVDTQLPPNSATY